MGRDSGWLLELLTYGASLRVASRIRKGGEGKAWLTQGAPRALIRPARSRGEAGYGSILGYDRGGQNGLCGRQTRSPGLPPD